MSEHRMTGDQNTESAAPSGSNAITGGSSNTATLAVASSPLTPIASTHAASIEADGVSNTGTRSIPPGPDDDEAPPEYEVDTVMHVPELLVEHAWSFLFSNVKAVLDGLTLSGGCIGGSRALNMFVPDSCTQQSDIDVYSAWNVHSIARILRSFASAGVVWRTVDSDNQRVLDPNIEEYSHKRLTIIRGYTTHNDSNIPVQLIFKKGMSPIQHIMTYYSSHVQCVLTGVGAVHLYHTLAMQKKGLIWPSNIENPASVNRGMLKYARRGWQLEWSQRSLENRTIKAKEPGSGARVILFQRQEGNAGENEQAVRSELRESRTAALMNLTWSQINGTTTYTGRFCPEVYHDERLQAYLSEVRQHETSRENCEEEYMSDLRLVRQHTTAFDMDGIVMVLVTASVHHALPTRSGGNATDAAALWHGELTVASFSHLRRTLHISTTLRLHLAARLDCGECSMKKLNNCLI